MCACMHVIWCGRVIKGTEVLAAIKRMYYKDKVYSGNNRQQQQKNMKQPK